LWTNLQLPKASKRQTPYSRNRLVATEIPLKHVTADVEQLRGLHEMLGALEDLPQERL